MTRPFDLEEFKLFVAGKPADEEYDGLDWNACALAQFGFPRMGSDRAYDYGIPLEVYRATALVVPYAFGALLSRLNNLPAESPTADEGGDHSPVSALTNDGGEDVR